MYFLELNIPFTPLLLHLHPIHTFSLTILITPYAINKLFTPCSFKLPIHASLYLFTPLGEKPYILPVHVPHSLSPVHASLNSPIHALPNHDPPPFCPFTSPPFFLFSNHVSFVFPSSRHFFLHSRLPSLFSNDVPYSFLFLFTPLHDL
ncbi:hypothetical protein LXL04_029996 [Taraxacum kok-saghyz]